MHLPKLLIGVGLAIATLGLFLHFAPRFPGLDGLNRLGRLPGDIRIERGGMRVYFPWVSCLLISLVLTLILQLVGRFRR